MRGLTLPSRGRLPASFACFQPPLMSNVRALAADPHTPSRSSRAACVVVGVVRRQGSPSRSLANALARPRSFQRGPSFTQNAWSARLAQVSFPAFGYAPHLAQQHCSAMKAVRESPNRVSSGRSPNRRPNPSVERASNGGAHWRAPPRSVAPLAAAHLELQGLPRLSSGTDPR